MIQLKLFDSLKIFPSFGRLIMLLSKVFVDLAPFLGIQANIWMLVALINFILKMAVDQKDYEDVPVYLLYFIEVFQNSLGGGGNSPKYPKPTDDADFYDPDFDTTIIKF